MLDSDVDKDILIIRLDERVKVLMQERDKQEAKINKLTDMFEAHIERLEKNIQAQTNIFNRYKWGFAGIVGMAMTIAWSVDIWRKIVGLFK